MNRIFITTFLVLSVAVTGCSTLRDSIITGVGSGAAIGAAGGAMAGRDEKKGQAALTGALVGAAIGGLSSYFIHKGIEKRDQKIRRDTIFGLDKHGVSTPSGFQAQGNHGVSTPVVESEWIDEHVTGDGKKLIESHRIWHIREDAQWVPAPKKKGK